MGWPNFLTVLKVCISVMGRITADNVSSLRLMGGKIAVRRGTNCNRPLANSLLQISAGTECYASSTALSRVAFNARAKLLQIERYRNDAVPIAISLLQACGIRTRSVHCSEQLCGARMAHES
ncbi:hypothetical protein BKA82DRAFT_4150561 [Pisolithus tinctorius]|nr:hypothetical protein BKA82DRAFT_4150561 [Pisolithus tinctorius]